MKKNIISITLATLILGGSNLLASDTTTLTKATVQLIKNYHSINTKVNNISNFSKSNLNKIESNKKEINKLNKSTNQINNDLKEIRNINNNQQNDIAKLYQKVNNAEEISKNAESTAFKTQKLVNEMRGISSSFKDNSNKVVTSANTAYKKSLKLEEKVNLMEKALKQNADTLNSTKSLLATKSAELQKLQKEYKAFKEASRKKHEELESKIKSQEIYIKAELKILKAKFDRARPVYVIDKENTEDCTNGKCKELSGSSDEIIKNFIN
jgi:chromosome segregation ATPase